MNQKTREPTYFLLCLLVSLSGILLLYTWLYEKNFVSGWIFAKPLANVWFTENSGRLIIEPFQNPQEWWQASINTSSYYFVNTLIYLMLHQVTGVELLKLFSYPFSAIGLGIVLLSVGFLFTRLKSFTPISWKLGLFISISCFALFHSWFVWISNSWIAYFLGYMMIGTLLNALLENRHRVFYSGLTILFLWLQFKTYHTVAISSFILLILISIYAIILKALFRTNYQWASVSSFFHLAILALAFLYLEPLFDTLIKFSLPLFSQDFIELFLRFFENLQHKRGFFDPLVVGRTIEGRIFQMLPLALLFITASYLFSLRLIGRKQTAPIDLIVDGLYLASIVALSSHLIISGIPRPTESYYFLSIGTPLMIARHFQYSYRGAKTHSPLTKRGFLRISPLPSRWLLLIATFIVTIVLSSLILASDPLLKERYRDLQAQITMAKWVSEKIERRFFADAHFTNLVLIYNPKVNVFSPHVLPFEESLKQFRDLYSGPSQFASKLAKWNCEIAIIKRNNITSALFLNDVFLKALPNYDFMISPFAIIYTDANNKVILIC
ncbi:hypothetical protein M1N05_00285 [Dehalococcoidales bacterium]|nr:hypothetical protein [Dehalococcoidales bacterium]